MKKIKLSRGMFALVDNEDFENLSKFTWYAHKGRITYYAYTHLPKTSKLISMHRMLMRTEKGLVTDHINRNGLDNRRQNLRICTNAQNLMNRGKNKNNTTGVKGIRWEKVRNAWKVEVGLDWKRIFIGRFKDLDEAKEARKIAVLKYHKEFALI